MAQKKRRSIKVQKQEPAVSAPPELQESKRNTCPIVGIGASAGGLESVSELLTHLPADTGLAVVVVQHLDPTHPSILAELLSRATQMPVRQVTHGTAVEPNHVYVIPPNAKMDVVDGVLHLVPRLGGRLHHMPIDYFLCSLAADRKSNAIGVILSGTASDGTLGLKAIKAEGGFTFAQDEQSAKFSSMPHNAIAAGVVDFIRPPRAIASELVRIVANPYVNRPTEAHPDTEISAPDDGLNKLFHLLRESSGVDFTHYKQATVNRRIKRRMFLEKFDEMEDYVRSLQKNPEHVQTLFQDLLIHVTSFFREPETFQALKETVFPELLKDRPPDEPIRIWVPGCSTGEEAYSIAICLQEYLENSKKSFLVQLFATEISEASLEKARTGAYPESIAAEVSPERLRRFFVKENGCYQVSRSIRDMCIFARHNLLKDPPFSRIDLISCRNVLIYLGAPLQKKASAVFHYALKPIGFLQLGNSETLSPAAEGFSVFDKKQKIYRKKPGQSRLSFELVQPGAMVDPFRPLFQEVRSEFDIQKEADRIVLSEYAPCGVLVNEDLKIVHFRGQTGAYLEPAPGEANFQLLKMARTGLLFELRSAIRQAKRKGVPVQRKGIGLQQDGRIRKVNLSVTPINDPPGRHFLVLFQDVPTDGSREVESGKEKASKAKQRRDESQLAALEEELATTKRYLQSIIEDQEVINEELKSANEEIQSSNEELQSTNEELETAKEELQSANEELTTVNEELQSRNLELRQVNNDLNNLLSSINLPVVMLGSDLRIRRFTPLAEKVLNFIPTDIGRPIADLKPNVDIPDLEGILTEVIQNLTVYEREVQDQQGRWHSLRVRPYRTLESKIEGVVLQFVDIDELKRSLEGVKQSRDYAEAIIETVREPLVVLSPDLHVKRANRSFFQTFQVWPDETLNQFFWELGNGQWNIPKLRQMLEEVLPHNTGFQDFEIEHDFERIGPKTMLLNARRIQQNGSTEMILLAIEDITELKAAAEARYRRLFEAAKDGILIVDAETGKITDANPYLVELFGYSRRELLGKVFWEAEPLKELQASRSSLDELREKGVVHYPDLPLNTKNGRQLEVEVVANVYMAGNKRVAQFNIRDITERKRSEDTLRRNQEELHQAQRMEGIGRLAGGVAHDFNNLLTAILGYSELLLNDLEENNSLRGDILEIQKAGVRAASLTRQLLAFGRRQVLQPKVLDLNLVVTEMDKMLHRLIGEDVELVNNSEPKLGCIKADPGQIELVIMNLAINARDAMPKGGKLIIETANFEVEPEHPRTDLDLGPGQYVMLAVSDTGTGMDAETRSHLFEPFFTTKPKGMGTGLGLSTVYGIVRQSGGSIWVYSEPGQGSSFKIYFPRVEEASETPQLQEALPERPRGSETILLVEDEVAVSGLVREILEKSGYTVLEAQFGDEALRICAEHQGAIQLLLTDVVMPRMSGPELAEGLSLLRPDLNVLFMSGHTEDAIVYRGVLNQGTAFLQKPFTPDALARRVRAVLDGTNVGKATS